MNKNDEILFKNLKKEGIPSHLITITSSQVTISNANLDFFPKSLLNINKIIDLSCNNISKIPNNLLINQRLILTLNKIKHLPFLKKNPCTSVHLDYNEIKSIAPLMDYSNIHLNHNKIKELPEFFLNGFVDFSCNEIHSISDIKNIKESSINLDYNPLKKIKGNYSENLYFSLKRTKLNNIENNTIKSISDFNENKKITIKKNEVDLHNISLYNDFGISYSLEK